MKKIVLAGACRTAIGTMGGALSTVPAAELGSIVIKEALNRAGVKAEQVDHVYMGCVIQAGLGQNVARQASIKAGLPVTTPAVTVNVVCGSGLNCVNMAAQMIETGDADIVVAGGMESMSLAPYAMMKGRYGYRMGNATLVDTMVNDALWDVFNNYHMGITADVAEPCREGRSVLAFRRERDLGVVAWDNSVAAVHRVFEPLDRAGHDAAAILRFQSDAGACKGIAEAGRQHRRQHNSNSQ